jgi:hypothetical protein
VSADGQVAFVSFATNLVPGQVDVGGGSPTIDVFLHAPQTGETRLVSFRRGSPGWASGGCDWNVPLWMASAGEAVVFSSDSQDLVENDFDASHDLGTAHRVWALDGDGTQREELPITPDAQGPSWRLAAVDDFDGDFDSDLVFQDDSTGTVELWWMQGPAREGPPVPLGAPTPGPGWRVVASADFDRDGRADLVWSHDTTRQVRIWTMNGATLVGQIDPVPATPSNPVWELAGAADFDGDGFVDLLWQNPATGMAAEWLLDGQGRRISGRVVQPSSARAGWRVVAVGDYGVGPGGRPGTPDLVWRHDTSGRLVLWNLDSSGVRTSGRFLKPAEATPPLGWRVAGPR